MFDIDSAAVQNATTDAKYATKEMDASTGVLSNFISIVEHVDVATKFPTKEFHSTADTISNWLASAIRNENSTKRSVCGAAISTDVVVAAIVVNLCPTRDAPVQNASMENGDATVSSGDATDTTLNLAEADVSDALTINTATCVAKPNHVHTTVGADVV